MFHEKHGGLILQQQFFYLHSGKHVDIIERLIPHIQVGRCEQAGGDQQFLFLPFGIFLHVFGELSLFQAELPEYGAKQADSQAAFQAKVREASCQPRGILINIGQDKPRCRLTASVLDDGQTEIGETGFLQEHFDKCGGGAQALDPPAAPDLSGAPPFPVFPG